MYRYTEAAKGVAGASSSSDGASGSSSSGSGMVNLGATAGDQLAAVIRAKTAVSKVGLCTS